MSWGMVAVGAGSLIAGAMGSSAAKKGARGQADAATYAADLQNEQFQQTREDMMPWLDAGKWSLERQQNFLNGDYGDALNSPDYQAAFSQGMKGLDRANAANLSLTSGGADADRIQFGQQLATQQIGNYWNRLAGMSGTGQTTAGQIGQFGAHAANNAGQQAMNGANANASAYAASANAWGNAAQGFAGYLGYRQGGR